MVYIIHNKFINIIIDATTTLECLPSDVYNHFDIYVLDFINLTKTNKTIRNLILNSSIRITRDITYTKNMKSWIRFLLNVKLTNENLEDIHLFANVHSLNLSNTNVFDVSGLGGVHTLNLSWTNVLDVSVLRGVYNL